MGSEMTSEVRVDVLFCGLIREPELLKKSIEDLIPLRKEKVVENIVLCVWDYEVDKYPGVRDFLKEKNVKLLEIKEPEDKGFGNIWCQMKSYEEGLKGVDEKNFVLKTRPDIYINPLFLRKLFSEKESILQIANPLKRGNVFKYKVWIPWYEITKPFYVSDECFFGSYDDMKLFYNYNSDYDKKYHPGKGISHVRKFINPFLEEFPELYNSLGVYNEEVKKKWWHDFMSKINASKYKILYTLAKKIRFGKLKKRLNNPKYMECLGIYYSILNSHFYIDSSSFPEQIVFREHSIPKELDSQSLEKNFSTSNIQRERGFQIYGYDEIFIKNLVGKRIEKTPITEKLIEIIERFS